MAKSKGFTKFLLENKSVRQTILKNTFWLSSGEIVSRLLRAAIIIYAARVLGVEGFGIFSYVLGLAGLLTIFSDLGMAPVVVREGAKDPQLRARYFSTALGLSFLLAAVSSAIIIFGTPLVTKFPVSQALIILIALVFIFDLFRGLTGSAIFRASEKMEGEAAVNFFTQLVLVTVGFLVIGKFRTPESVALSYALGSAGGLLLALYLTRHYIRSFISRFDKALIKPLLSASIPMSLAAILGAVMINTDTVLLGWLTTASDVGLFAAAQKPILLLYIIPSFVAAAIFPPLARFAKNNPDNFRLLTEKGLAAVLLLGFPLVAGLLLTTKEIVELLYGTAYLPSVNAMKILSLTLLTMFPMSMLVNGIFAYNEQKFLTKIGLVGVAVNAALDLIFIPIWGIAGCALATLLVQFTTSTLIWFKMKKLNYFVILGSLKKIIAATLIMGTAIFTLTLFNVPLLVIVAAAIIIYFGSLLLLKETLFRDLRTILAS